MTPNPYLSSVIAAGPPQRGLKLVAAATLRCAAEAPLLSQLPAPPARLAEQLARYDRLCGLAVVVSERLHAGLATPAVSPDRVAVLCASRHGCLATDEAFYRGVRRGEASPRLFAYTLHSSPVGAVSIQHGYGGPGHTVVGSAVAGLQLLTEAQQLFASQQADACLILSCDLAEPPELNDQAAALLFLPADAAMAPKAGCAVHAIWDTYQPAQPEAALADCIAALDPQAASPSALSVLRGGGPVLLQLAEHSAVEAAQAALSAAPLERIILAATDEAGQAAAALISLVR